MKRLQNIWWFLGFVFSYAIVLAGTEQFLTWAMPNLGISPNRSTAGAYTSEMVALMCCSSALIARVVIAMNTAGDFNRAIKVLFSKTALASLAVVGMVAVQIQNRGLWWIKHMFTNEAYDHIEYTATASSLLHGISMIALVFAVYPTKPPGSKMALSDFGSDRLAAIILVLSLFGFVLGGIFYSGRP